MASSISQETGTFRTRKLIVQPLSSQTAAATLGEGGEKDSSQLDCALAFPLTAEFTRQESQSIAPGEEIVFQNVFTGHVNHPVGLFRTGKEQAASGLAFNVQAVQRKLNIGGFREEQESLRGGNLL